MALQRAAGEEDSKQSIFLPTVKCGDEFAGGVQSRGYAERGGKHSNFVEKRGSEIRMKMNETACTRRRQHLSP